MLVWRKAIASGNNNGCVEVATDGSNVFVRDSKDQSKVLTFTPFEWECFLDGVGKGEFSNLV